MKSPESHKFSNDFKGNKKLLNWLKFVNIRREIWRRFLTIWLVPSFWVTNEIAAKVPCNKVLFNLPCFIFVIYAKQLDAEETFNVKLFCNVFNLNIERYLWVKIEKIKGIDYNSQTINEANIAALIWFQFMKNPNLQWLQSYGKCKWITFKTRFQLSAKYLT